MHTYQQLLADLVEDDREQRMNAAEGRATIKRLSAIVEATASMREYQRAWFKTRDKRDLNRALALESKVDRLLAERTTGTLFDRCSDPSLDEPNDPGISDPDVRRDALGRIRANLANSRGEKS